MQWPVVMEICEKFHKASYDAEKCVMSKKGRYAEKAFAEIREEMAKRPPEIRDLVLNHIIKNAQWINNNVKKRFQGGKLFLLSKSKASSYPCGNNFLLDI